MSNQDISRAWEYHNRTKHSWESVRSSRHYLDWGNLPRPFKVYPKLAPIPLPAEVRRTGIAALAAVASPGVPSQEAAPDRQQLAHLLFFSAGITKRRAYPGGEVLFRAAACTGALYEIDLYVVCGALADLAAGVYHFSPLDLALRRLREGDYRGVVTAAAGHEAAVARAPAIVVATGTYWRNAWKYQARTYRHFGWDNGTLHANLLAAAAALGLPARLVAGFVDDEISRLLGLDTDREVALSLVALGQGSPAPSAAPVVPLELETAPYSPHEVDYPAMREMHRASSLASAEEVVAWRGVPPEKPSAAAVGELARLEPLSDEQAPPDSFEDVVLRRGSTRQFGRDPIRLDQLATILDRSTRGVPADFAPAGGACLNDLYLVAHAVEGLDPGAYFYRAAEQRLELVKRGEFRSQAARLGLDQELPGGAAAAMFFLADLDRWLGRFGNRGYRAVQLEAGILGGKMYLAAYAQRLGATGLTFYDDEVTEFFSQHAAGKSAIFLVAVGLSARAVAGLRVL